MTDLQGTAFALLIVSHGMALISGNKFAQDTDLTAWSTIVGAIIISLCAFSLITGPAA